MGREGGGTGRGGGGLWVRDVFEGCGGGGVVFASCGLLHVGYWVIRKVAGSINSAQDSRATRIEALKHDF